MFLSDFTLKIKSFLSMSSYFQTFLSDLLFFEAAVIILHENEGIMNIGKLENVGHL